MQTRKEKPSLSIVIPCLNEERYIAKCLDSILENDYPKDKLEIFVIDGLSTDHTRKIVKNYTVKYPFIRLLDNPRKLTPSAINMGIKNSTGQIIMRLDAHTTYSPNYVSECVAGLEKYQASNVGGMIKTMPGNPSFLAKAISLAISHPFGVGNSNFRLANSKEDHLLTDTVPFGCFPRDLFEKIGFFNENLPKWRGRCNEDLEFNMRIKNSGGKIVLLPHVMSYYYSKGTLREFLRHCFDNGFLTTTPMAIIKNKYPFRHLVPILSLITFILLFVLSFESSVARVTLCSSVFFYSGLSAYFSLKTSMRQKNILYLFTMPFVFFALHASYGLGSLCGLLSTAKKRLFCKAINVPTVKMN